MTVQCLKRNAADLHERLSDLHTRFQATAAQVGERARDRAGTGVHAGLRRSFSQESHPTLAAFSADCLQTSHAQEWHSTWAEQV